jgi:hypothetical protein
MVEQGSETYLGIKKETWKKAAAFGLLSIGLLAAFALL